MSDNRSIVREHAPAAGRRRAPSTPRRFLAAVRRALPALGERLRSTTGSMTILTTGVLVVILLVMAVGAAITGVHLERNALQSAADSTALAAAQGVDAEQLYTPGNGPVISPSTARTAAREHLERYPLESARTHGISLDAVSVAGDGTVTVVLTARTDPPLAGWFTRGTGTSIPLAVEGEARAR